MQNIVLGLDGRPWTTTDKPRLNQLINPLLRSYLQTADTYTPEYIRNAYQQANSGNYSLQYRMWQQTMEDEGQTKECVKRFKRGVSKCPWQIKQNSELSLSKSTAGRAQDDADWCEAILMRLNMRKVMKNLLDKDFFGLSILQPEWATVTDPKAMTTMESLEQVPYNLIRRRPATGMAPGTGIPMSKIQVDFSGVQMDWRDITPWDFVFAKAEDFEVDPGRGGLFRSITSWVILKMVFLRAMSIYAEKLALGIPVAKHPNTEGYKEGEEAYKALDQAMQEVGLNGYMLLPDDVDFKFENPPTGWQFFISGIDKCDDQISFMILGHSFGAHEAMFGTYSKQESAQDVSDGVMEDKALELMEIIQKQVVVPLFLQNFGPDYVRYVPTFDLLYKPQADLNQIGQIVERAAMLTSSDPTHGVSGKDFLNRMGAVLEPYDPTDPDDFKLVLNAGAGNLRGQNPGGLMPGMNAGLGGQNMRTYMGKMVDEYTKVSGDFFTDLVGLCKDTSPETVDALRSSINAVLRPFIRSNDVHGAAAALKHQLTHVAKSKGADLESFRLAMKNAMLLIGIDAMIDHKTRRDLTGAIRRLNA